ncbi:hypothetical protein CDG76_34570 [Nostoc sp. 'Peltigera membranacea cyanobiont' 210A]|nr:hypothetical protein CDG76_34570 [Nostoc sp. 'Peltigera membranacea cyanobiont' 210A]
MDSITRLHDVLLSPTIQNALKTPFFRDLLTGRELPETVNEIGLLPIIRKEEVRAAGRLAQNREGLVCNEVSSSGSTGPPFLTIRGDRELSYIWDFFSQVFPINDSRTRVLQINNPFHGFLITVPAPIHSHRIGIYDNASFEHGIRTITSRHTDRNVDDKCTVLVGMLRTLIAFAQYLESKGIAPLKSDLNTIISFGSYITPESRAFIESSFCCRVRDRYGLSEVFGGAAQSGYDDWYYFDPCVIPEVVDYATRVPIKEGLGVLVLTPLYPFQEAQPLLRYWTGDLVVATHSRPGSEGRLAIKPLGRARYGVYDNVNSTWVVTPNEAYEAAVITPGLDKVPLFRDSGQVVDPIALGHPMYSISSVKSSDDDRLNIMLRYVLAQDSNYDPTRVSDRLRENLIARSQNLRRYVQQGKAVLSVATESSLEYANISRPD